MIRKLGFEALLRLRKAVERASRLELQRVNTEVSQTKDEIAKLTELRHITRRDLLKHLMGGIRGEQFALYSLSAFDARGTALAERLFELQEKAEQADRIYANCRRERKVIENALERRRQEQQEDQKRTEQRANDDATLQRRARLPHL